MANIKITDLNAIADPISTDVLPIVDVSADTTNKISIETLLKNAAAGTAALPAFAFDADPNTGMYRSGADALAFSTGGTGRLFIDSSGRLGIGTSTPGAPLDVNGAIFSRSTGVYTNALTSYSGSNLYINAGSSSFYVLVGGSERLRINSSGNVGIGTSSPAHAVHIAGATTPELIVEDTTNSVKAVVGADNTVGRIGTDTNHALTLRTNDTERMRIDSSGRVGIGTSSPDGRITVQRASNNQGISGGIAFKGQDGTTQGGVGTDGVNTNNLQILAAQGIYFHTGNTDGTANIRATLDSSGRLGIGTSSPSYPLDVNSAVIQVGNSTDGFVQYKSTAGNWHAGANASNAFAFYGGTYGSGSERMRIDSSGRLLVGTSSSVGDDNNLQVVGSTADASSATFWRSSSDTGNPSINFVKTRGSVASPSIVSSGDILGHIRFNGHDGASHNSRAAEIKAFVDGTPGANDMPGRLVFSTTADGASSPTERMRISANGKVSIGRGTTNLASFTTGAYLKLSTGADTTTGDFSCESYAGNAGTRYHFGFSNTNGLVGSITTNSSATAYNTSSDYRLKENVVPLTGAADRVNQLQVRRFNFIADPDKTVDGFLAHEAQAVVPEAVTGTHDEVDDDGNPIYQGIDQSKLVPLLTAALQEAIAKIETLEQRLTDAGL